MIFGHNKQRENSNVDTAKDKEACGEDCATTSELFREHFNIDGKRKMGIVSYLKLGTYVFAIVFLFDLPLFLEYCVSSWSANSADM